MYVGAPIKTGAYPSVATIMGSLGSQALIQELNDSSGASRFFGSAQDRFAATFTKFNTELIAPWYQQQLKLESTVQTLMRKDEITALTSLEAFNWIPPVMQLPILLDPEVLQLLKQGRIDGFGYSYEQLKDVEDVYGHTSTTVSVSVFRKPYRRILRLVRPTSRLKRYSGQTILSSPKTRSTRWLQLGSSLSCTSCLSPTWIPPVFPKNAVECGETWDCPRSHFQQR